MSTTRRPDNSDADLLDAEQTELIPVKSAAGEIGEQPWYYPEPEGLPGLSQRAKAGGVLGVNTRQMNREYTDPSGFSDNELRAWSRLGLFEPGFKDGEDSRLRASRIGPAM